MYECFLFFFFFKQKTAYEMRMSDWSSDVCSSDLIGQRRKHLFDTCRVFLLPSVHHPPHLLALQLFLRAAEIARNDRERLEPRVFGDITLAAVREWQDRKSVV